MTKTKCESRGDLKTLIDGHMKINTDFIVPTIDKINYTKVHDY